MASRIPIENAQFTLYYLLIAADGTVTEQEKAMFVNIVSGVGGFRKSYAESIFNGMHKFKHLLNYKNAIETIAATELADKHRTVRVMRELCFADGTLGVAENAFLTKVQQDLGLLDIPMS